MTNSILKDINNNSTTTNNKEMITMNIKFFEDNYGMDKNSLEESGLIEEAFEKYNNETAWKREFEIISNYFGTDLKSYKDTIIRLEKEGEKVVITVNFYYEDKPWNDIESANDKQNLIDSFSDDPLAEEILKPIGSDEEEAKVEKALEELAEIINNFYNTQMEPHQHFYKSVEEIKKDYGGIENVEIIVKDNDTDDMFVNYITATDVEIWRINMGIEDY